MNKFAIIMSNLIYSIRSIKDILPTHRFCHKETNNKTIFVIGNGPSLNGDIKKIKKENNVDIFSVNDFGISEYFQEIKPKYYILADPAYWEKETNCNENDVIYRERLYESFSRINWNMTLFIPWSAYKTNFFQNKINNHNIKILPFNYTNFAPSRTKYYKFILFYNLGVVPVGNILGCAIYLSINLNYSTIKILGADHSWTKDIRVNNNNQVCVVKRHFFENSEFLEPWRKSNKEIFRMSEILYSLRNHFLGYEYLEWYSKQVGSTIINCTSESFIDAFKRESI